MTILIGFQGKDCALIASDLMVKFYSPEELQKSVQDRVYKTYISPKFRKVHNGDLLAFNGRLNPGENTRLYEKSLEELTRCPLIDDQGIRADQKLTVMYASVSDSQVYSAESTSPLVPFGKGQFSACADQISYTLELMSLTQRLLRDVKKFDQKFLMRLSRAYEDYMISKEANTEMFGGYISHILRPGNVWMFSKNPGKLKGCETIDLEIFI